MRLPGHHSSRPRASAPLGMGVRRAAAGAGPGLFCHASPWTEALPAHRRPLNKAARDLRLPRPVLPAQPRQQRRPLCGRYRVWSRGQGLPPSCLALPWRQAARGRSRGRHERRTLQRERDGHAGRGRTATPGVPRAARAMHAGKRPATPPPSPARRAGHAPPLCHWMEGAAEEGSQWRYRFSLAALAAGRGRGRGRARLAGRRKWSMAAGAGGLVAAAALLLAVAGPRPAPAELTDGNSEHLKREHSLMKPYQGAGSAAMPLWDFQGSTMVTSQYVRLTPDERSREGSIWNRVPCFLKDWELHVHFKIHGAGKKNLHGDGLALWYTQERLVPGPVFGSKDNFHGLAIFLDTYPNDEATERVFPYISAMVNNGSLTYDHSKDGRWTELAGCTADLRNQNHDTFLAVRYSRGRLTVMTDVEDKNEWKNCIDIAGVQLPTGYFFGASAGTGDLSDNHDIISMKLFQLMVEHPLEDESVDWTKIEPSVSLLKSPKDNVDDPTGNFRSGPLTGWKVFLLLLCALLGIIVCAVVGAVVFQKRQERNKRFY
ncbi:vesicular integral-membrane protein VIP36 [Cuculus canorus]|uniref:vesicular integral-membrane protein VIP36 n=1 Tax=Cuculus canorus TaxID=55661 RepID=UPI0023AA3D60|nr:vesicular integral-membrane protein VIP36 [Cuculus canorus]